MERRPDIDALRVGATYLLFVFHTAKVYDEPPFYHLKHEEPSLAAGVFTSFVHQWHMPLLFLLAGWALAASLRRRDPGEVRRERVRRLFVPLVVGSLLMGPVIRHVELRRIDGIDEPFWAYLPTFFTPDRFSWSHLWFLAYLFTFTLLYLPLLTRLDRRGDLPVRRAHLVVAVALLVVVQVGLRHAWPGFQNLVWDWANFAFYSAFFIGGWLIGRFRSVDRLVDGHWVVAGSVGLTATAFQAPYWLDLWSRDTLVGYVAYQALSAVAAAGIVAGLLGSARRMLRRETPALRWLSDSAFPVYVLHQLAVVVTAVHVVDRPWPLAVKFAVTLVVASLATVGAYALVVRRAPLLWPLFGIGAPRLRASGPPLVDHGEHGGDDERGVDQREPHGAAVGPLGTGVVT